MTGTSQGAADIQAERQRQMETEGFTDAHDDKNTDHEFIRAAWSYMGQVIADDDQMDFQFMGYWPDTWSPDWFKPTTSRRNLVKAGALIAAEIDRQDRAMRRAKRQNPMFSILTDANALPFFEVDDLRKYPISVLIGDQFAKVEGAQSLVFSKAEDGDVRARLTIGAIGLHSGPSMLLRRNAHGPKAASAGVFSFAGQIFAAQVRFPSHLVNPFTAASAVFDLHVIRPQEDQPDGKS